LQDNILQLKVHFESKLIQFLNGHRTSCLWFMKHYQTKDKWKKMQCPSIKYFSLWYGHGFYILKNYYAFISKKESFYLFLNEASSRNFKLVNGPKFNWCISISYTIIFLIHQKIPHTILVLKYICNFSSYVTSIILSQIYFGMFKFFIFFWILNIYIRLSFKLIKCI